ncbi:MAG: AbrB/MazE/SpoVT family DNA-binding domain-containing protein [Candidatus Aenigmarchaeota archaeon]|nr:AbrB/MazE/SpoVT family DNA-binding domain-containing protein [Candidatus Aenigmarchaeota archaeon]
MLKALDREIDDQGRIILPLEWRRKHGRKVAIVQVGNTLRVIPKNAKNITDFFDKAKIDVKSDLKDWERVKRELIG